MRTVRVLPTVCGGKGGIQHGKDVPRTRFASEGQEEDPAELEL